MKEKAERMLKREKNSEWKNKDHSPFLLRFLNFQ